MGEWEGGRRQRDGKRKRAVHVRIIQSSSVLVISLFNVRARRAETCLFITCYWPVSVDAKRSYFFTGYGESSRAISTATWGR